MVSPSPWYRAPVEPPCHGARPTVPGPPVPRRAPLARPRPDDAGRRSTAVDRARRPPAQADGERRDAGRLQRLRLRPVPGPHADGDGHLAAPLAVPRGRHLHLRRLPGLPQPAQPHARPGSRTQLAQRLAAAARSRSGRRPRATRGSRATATTDRINTDPGQAGPLRQGAPAGRGRGRPRPSPRPRRWASSPGSTMWYDLEGFDLTNTRCRESALAFLSAWTTRDPRAALRLRRLLQRRLGHQDARRRAGQRPRPPTTSPTRSGSPAGTACANTSTSYIRDDGWRPRRPDEAVPGRPRRDLGRRHDQHRPRLPRPRPRLGGAAPRRHCDGVASTSRTTRAAATRRPDPRRGSRRSSACSQEHGVYAGKVNGIYDAATIAAVNAWQTAHGFTAGRPGPGAAG